MLSNLKPLVLSLSLCLAAPMLHAVEIIAHRGASHDAPENTVASSKLGFQQKADGVELDVYLAKDNSLPVIHDATTKRTTGVDGKIKEMTLAEYKKLDAGTWKNAKYAGEKIPTLDEMLETVPKGKKMVIEIKDKDVAIVPPMIESVKRMKMTPKDALFISFNYPVLLATKKALPEYTALYLASYKPDKTTGEVKPTLDELIAQAKEAKFEGLNLDYKWPIDEAFVKKIHGAGLKFYVWTVNDAEVAKRLVAAGVDGITTDRPEWLREQLKK